MKKIVILSLLIKMISCQTAIQNQKIDEQNMEQNWNSEAEKNMRQQLENAILN